MQTHSRYRGAADGQGGTASRIQSHTMTMGAGRDTLYQIFKDAYAMLLRGEMERMAAVLRPAIDGWQSDQTCQRLAVRGTGGRRRTPAGRAHQ